MLPFYSPTATFYQHSVRLSSANAAVYELFAISGMRIAVETHFRSIEALQTESDVTNRLRIAT
jgi:hypothetical protein